MGMFDHYRPSGERRCPECQRLLESWQGKDGPNGLFLWVEGARAAADQLVDEECRLDPEERQGFSLPRRFVNYSHDCPKHQPVDAECEAPEGTWTRTVLRPFAE